MSRNPYPIYATDEQSVLGWKWKDEDGCPCDKTFKSQNDALTDLMRYIRWLDHGPTIWQKLWWPVRYTWWPALVKFWNAEGHA